MMRKMAWGVLVAALSLCAMLFSASGNAETALEHEVLSAPSPHIEAHGEPQVRVHFASLNGYLDGNPNNKERLQKLHDDVGRCVANGNPTGGPVNPPTEWPDHLNGTREDFYVTDRYSITYFESWIYGYLDPDCNHMRQGVYQHTAVLKSSAGRCEINLITKIAKGLCDMAVHRTAIVRATSTPTAHATEQIVAGLKCEQRQDFMGKICIATDGKMTPVYPLVLSRQSEHGVQMKAMQAALDMNVSEAVLTPHLQGGFTIQASKK